MPCPLVDCCDPNVHGVLVFSSDIFEFDCPRCGAFSLTGTAHSSNVLAERPELMEGLRRYVNHENSRTKGQHVLLHSSEWVTWAEKFSPPSEFQQLFGSTDCVPEPRRKLKAAFGPCQLFIEQIGPSLWNCSIRCPVMVGEWEGEEYRLRSEDKWDGTTCLDEACAKQCAIVTVLNWPGMNADPGRAPIWIDESEKSDKEWKSELEKRDFPGYLDREGMERFPNF